MDVKRFGMKNLNRGRLLNGQMQKTMEKLASGFRINRAADDAAGLAVSEKLRVEMSEQQQCVQNVRHGTNLARTADAALQEVNDMMKRAETLCLQAKNGTFSELERQELTDELNALYDEMERIFDSAEFADTKLFHYDSPDEIGDYPKKIKELVEHAEPLPRGVYAEWGDLGVVPHRTFDKAVSAEPATATIRFDSEVKLNDASSLEGKSFYIKPNDSKYGVYATFSAQGSYVGTVSYGGNSYRGFNIATAGLTVQQAMDKLCAEIQSYAEKSTTISPTVIPQQAAVDAHGMLTITLSRSALVENVAGEDYRVEDGMGSAANGVEVFSREQKELLPVDGIDNEQIYSPVGTATVTVLSGITSLDGRRDALKKNTLSIGDDLVVDFTDDEVDGFTSVDDVRQAVVNKINATTVTTNATAVLNANGSMTVTKNNCTESSTYISETVNSKETIQTQTPQVEVSPTSETPESVESCDVTINDTSLPLSIQIEETTYTFCRSENMVNYSVASGERVYLYSDNTLREIASKIESLYGSEKMSYSISGNTITLRGKYAGDHVGFDVATAQPVSLTKSNRAMLSGSTRLVQERTLPIDLSVMNSGGVSALNGRGFTLLSVLYEFNDGTTPQINPDAIVIDTSACNRAADVGQMLEQLLDGRYGADYLSVTESSEMLYIAGNSVSFSDGNAGTDGLFNDEGGMVRATAAGGTDVNRPGTTIDFSDYDASNFEKLYGTGFRVTCATCEGEFINVMFCYDKDQANFPESFDYVDENGDPIKDENGNPYVDEKGNPRKIHNCVVELKKMTSGSDIVRSIVDQLAPELDHFTGMGIGTPDTVLTVYDKRAGDRPNPNDPYEPLRARIIPGVYTNCIYSKKILRHPNPETYIDGPDGSTTAYYGYCSVYAGDTEGKPEWIYVHLPNLSLNMLNLDPPRPDLTQVDTIDDVCSRLKVADNLISTARGQLGADQNRLDHAKMNLTVSAEQTADTYSRIRDLDMAEGMTEQVKLSILQQTQQSALAHIHQQGSEILKLMQ